MRRTTRTGSRTIHSPARRPAARLRLEPLEDRAVPAFGFGWALGIGGPSTNYADRDCGSDIATDAQGNVYVSGRFGGTVDFDPGATHPGDTDILTSGGSYDGFAAKYTPAGGLVWAVDLGASVGGTGIAVRDGDPYAVTGRSPADTSDTTAGPVRVVRLDAATGTPVWTTTIASGTGGRVALGPSGSVYAFGCKGGNFVSATLGAMPPDGPTTVARLDPATGAVLWSRATTGGSVVGARVAVDGADNVYLTGRFIGTTGFGGRTLTSLSGTEDAFVWRLDGGGATVWAGGLGSGSGKDAGGGIAVDGGGNVYVGGSWTGSTNGNKPQPAAFQLYPGGGSVTLPFNGTGDIFVAKLAPNPDGSLRTAWVKSVGGGLYDSCTGVAVDGAGNVYATGMFCGSGNKQGVDFDPGSGTFYMQSAGVIDVFVLKLDPNGNFVTAAHMGATRVTAHGTSIAVDGSGSVYTTGIFESTADFDPTSGTYNLTSNGGYDCFVSKLTQAGGQMVASATTPYLAPDTTDPVVGGPRV